ncbi:MAG: Imm17 family immunity protein [Methanopyri archaeon]|nr:Imm17 family immunity protein [Methanopyri archaeon]
MKYMGWLISLVGLFAVVGAAFDLPVFMQHPKARRLSMAFGYSGARIFYILFGLILIIVGLNN